VIAVGRAGRSLVAACSLLLVFAPRARAEGPAVAIEDTMSTEIAEVLVRAPRVTLDEILDRVARGEARRDSMLQDQSFTATMRVLRNPTGKGKQPQQLYAETVSRVYRKKPNLVRTVTLRRYEYKPARDKLDRAREDEGRNADVETDFSPGMGEEIVNFAFRPENRRNYRFRIEDRKLLGDHLLYTLAFEPRSALAVHEPMGRVWVDTKDYVIVRQELAFRQSPVPLFLKSIPHMVVERTRAGDFWVLSRALVRMELTVPIPRMGRSFDFGMAFSDYAVNAGLPDSLFAGPGSSGRNRVQVRVGSRR
jgi:outer membrane lipoprotein-sorting protein